MLGSNFVVNQHKMQLVKNKQLVFLGRQPALMDQDTF